MHRANQLVLIRFGMLVGIGVLLSLMAPAGERLSNFAALFTTMFFVSLVFAAIKREPPRGDRLTHLDEAAGFFCLSWLAYALVGESL